MLHRAFAPPECLSDFPNAFLLHEPHVNHPELRFRKAVHATGKASAQVCPRELSHLQFRLSGACLAMECARRAGYSEWVAKKATFIIERAPLVALVLKEHRRREDEEFKQLMENLGRSQ